MMLTLLVATLTALVQADAAPRTVSEIMETAPEGAWVTPDPDTLIYMDTEQGQIVIRLQDEMAPAHGEQIRKLIEESYYDGLHFYRVIEGFVAQGGDESGTRDKGGAADTLPAEFEQDASDDLPFTPLGYTDGYAAEVGFVDGMPAGRDPETGTVWLAHCTGAFAFGRDVGRDTASTEFYITLQPQRYLDRNLTVFGRVLDGMSVVQSIPRGELNNGGTIADRARWTRIERVRLGSQVPGDEQTQLQYMDTGSATFAELIRARAARPSDFFYYRPNHIDLCQMPIPVRVRPTASAE
jgi:peptidylprolyl isomerase